MTLESAIAFAIGMFLLALSPGPGLATGAMKSQRKSLQ
jgi:threonine/homoserine/homoserine lactone efflux protein